MDVVIQEDLHCYFKKKICNLPYWNRRNEINASIKAGLIILLGEHGYPPVERDEVYVDIFEHAENFKSTKKV